MRFLSDVFALVTTFSIIQSSCGSSVQSQETLQRPHLSKEVSWPGSETIYTFLTANAEFSKLTKTINFVDEIVKVLNDTSANLTFFAVPDWALQSPGKDHPVTIASPSQAYDLVDIVHLVEEHELKATLDGHDDKKFLKKLVRAVLSYHILPSRFNAIHLADNNTLPTHLVLPNVLGARPLRIRVTHSLIPPMLTVNLYSRVVRPDNLAINGIVHVVNHPLLPPPPAFQGLFLAPSVFSIFTSAVQRAELTEYIDLSYIRGKGDMKGSLNGAAAVTIFAPTNRAFESLPKELQLFLFSPFGIHALKKLLQYHIVPDLVFHTDYQFNRSDLSSSEARNPRYPPRFDSAGKCADGCIDFDSLTAIFQEAPVHPTYICTCVLALDDTCCRSQVERLHMGPILSFNQRLITLSNHSLYVHVEKFNFTIPIPGPHRPHKISTKFTANGHPVAVPDIISLNGAIHLIDHILNPRGHYHQQDNSFQESTSWDDWEDWLPQWAN